jgi:bacterioferritin-associated ferredoxin
MTDSGQGFDVAIIGAGETGRAAALAAAGAGARVALIDQRTIARAGLPDTVAAMPATRAWGLFRGGEIGLISDGETRVLRAASIIVATGARDVLAPFHGWTLANVVACDDAMWLLESGTFTPKRIAIVSDDATPDLDTLLANGKCTIVARVSSQQFATFSAQGTDTVASVTVDGQDLPADAVIMAIGRQPDDALGRMAGAVSLWRPELGGNVPLRDELLRVNRSWCWVAGDAAGLLHDPAIGVEEGALAGECAALMALGKPTGNIAGYIAQFRAAHPDRVPEQAESRADDPLAAWLRGLTGETVVCRCEGIDAGAIQGAIDAGMRSINDVKRRTRAGMGSCQGGWCTRVIGTMLADAGVPELDPAPMTSRPPSGLVSVGELARLRGV